MRRRIVKISDVFIADLCRTTRFGEYNSWAVEGVPLDAKMIGVQYDVQCGCFLVCFEHDLFDDIKEGCQLPNQGVKITKQDLFIMPVMDFTTPGPVDEVGSIPDHILEEIDKYNK